MTLLQSSFLPDDLEGWARVLGELLVFGALVFGALRWYLMVQIDGVGERVNKLEKTSAAQTRAHRDLRDDVRDERNTATRLHEDIGRLEKTVENLTTALDFNRNARIEESRDIGERLARIEEKIDGDQEIKQALVKLLGEQRRLRDQE